VQDWKQHKAACKAAQAAAAATESSVVVNLQEAVLDVPYITGIRMNTSVQDMLQSARSNVTTGQAASGAAPDVARNPARRFIVKVQAPLSGGVSELTGGTVGVRPEITFATPAQLEHAQGRLLTYGSVHV
jgi:hypothetical protein